MTAINIVGWDLSKVTAVNSTSRMFLSCKGLTTLTVPSSLTRVDNEFNVNYSLPRALTVCNFYPPIAPIVNGTPFNNYGGATPVPLHVPVGATGYNVAPWTDTAIFSSIIADL